jgi:hypothetical protein
MLREHRLQQSMMRVSDDTGKQPAAQRRRGVAPITSERLTRVSAPRTSESVIAYFDILILVIIVC